MMKQEQLDESLYGRGRPLEMDKEPPTLRAEELARSLADRMNTYPELA